MGLYEMGILQYYVKYRELQRTSRWIFVRSYRVLLREEKRRCEEKREKEGEREIKRRWKLTIEKHDDSVVRLWSERKEAENP